MIYVKWFGLVFLVILLSFNAFAAGGGGGGGGGAPAAGSSVPSLSVYLQIAVIAVVAYLYRKRK